MSSLETPQEDPAMASSSSSSSLDPNPNKINNENENKDENNNNNSKNPESPSSIEAVADDYDWSYFKDDDDDGVLYLPPIDSSLNVPFVGDKEPLSSLAEEFQSGSPILQEKIKLIGEQYAAMRRTKGDGNCFFRSFMFSYLEHILETQDKSEVERITINIDQCKKTLLSLGFAEFTFDDFFSIFMEQLESVLQGNKSSISHEELLDRCRGSISDYVVMFFRFVTSGEVRRRSEFYEPFVAGLTNSTVDQFCKTSVEPMGEESDHMHVTALSDALGVATRVINLDRSSCEEAGALTVNHHDFIPPSYEENNNCNPPKFFVTLLYRPGHYDILYPK